MRAASHLKKGHFFTVATAHYDLSEFAIGEPKPHVRVPGVKPFANVGYGHGAVMNPGPIVKAVVVGSSLNQSSFVVSNPEQVPRPTI